MLSLLVTRPDWIIITISIIKQQIMTRRNYSTPPPYPPGDTFCGTPWSLPAYRGRFQDRRE